MTRSSYHHGDLRKALLDRAVEILASGDGDTLSLRGVARAAGVSPMATYRHFADKRELIAAVADMGFRKLHRSLDRAARKSADDPAGLYPALALAYVRFAMRNKAHFRVMTGAEMLDVADDVSHGATQCFGVLRRSIVDGQQAGVLRAGDPDEMALAGWASIQGLAQLLVNDLIGAAGLSKKAVDERVRRMVLALFLGVAQPAGSPRRAR